MDIDLRDFQDNVTESLHIEDEIQRDSLDIQGRHINFIEPIRYEGDIYKVAQDKILHINIYYKYEEACGRCLDLYENEDKSVLTGKLVEETREEDEDEEENLIYYVDDKLDLTEDIIETIILNLPMKPLCSKKCKGLCPKCGTNLNKEQCDCKIEYVDPRFEKLEKLKKLLPEE